MGKLEKKTLDLFQKIILENTTKGNIEWEMTREDKGDLIMKEKNDETAAIYHVSARKKRLEIRAYLPVQVEPTLLPYISYYVFTGQNENNHHAPLYYDQEKKAVYFYSDLPIEELKGNREFVEKLIMAVFARVWITVLIETDLIGDICESTIVTAESIEIMRELEPVIRTRTAVYKDFEQEFN